EQETAGSNPSAARVTLSQFLFFQERPFLPAVAGSYHNPSSLMSFRQKVFLRPQEFVDSARWVKSLNVQSSEHGAACLVFSAGSSTLMSRGAEGYLLA